MAAFVWAQVLRAGGIIIISVKGELEGVKAHFFELFHANKLQLITLILQWVPTARTSSSSRSSPLQILLIGPSSLRVQSSHFLWFQCLQLWYKFHTLEGRNMNVVKVNSTCITSMPHRIYSTHTLFYWSISFKWIIHKLCWQVLARTCFFIEV